MGDKKPPFIDSRPARQPVPHVSEGNFTEAAAKLAPNSHLALFNLNTGPQAQKSRTARRKAQTAAAFG